MFKYFILAITLFSSILFAQLPTLKVADKSLKISNMKVDIEIVGSIATTTFDITYYNPYKRDLTGEFSMPMNEGQEISRYALMVGDKLREGVVVQKVKARQAFEAVVAQKIDPGIINITKGNYFKTKIYPIPAKGHKRVVIALTETLQDDHYILPIQNQKPIDKFSLDIKILKGNSTEQNILSEFNTINITQDNQAYMMHFNKENFSLKKPIKFALPKLDKTDHQLFTETIGGKTYFYLNVKTPDLQKMRKKLPKKITIYWDNSFSASSRDRAKELELLESYLKAIDGVKKVSLVAFNYRMLPAKQFSVGSDVSNLINYIKSLKNDGGTTLARLKFDAKSDEILLFSDAINTIGGESVSISKKPIYTISSSAGSNYTFLKKLASQSNGEFINLDRLSTKKALEVLLSDEEKFLSCKYNKSTIAEVYPNTPMRVGKFLQITGVLKSSQGKLTLNYGSKKGITAKQTYTIEKKSSSPIARIWASKKIEVLSWNEAKNSKTIEVLSKKYSILTKNTAFIVLDRVEDYVTHCITPPKELRKAYDTLIAEQKKLSKEKLQTVHQRNLERITQLKEWYKNPPKIEEYNAPEPIEEENGIGGDIAPMVIAEPSVESSQRRVRSTSKAKKETHKKAAASIKILAWLPDAPYMKKLRKISTKEFDKHYYTFKKENRNRPAFYIEVSDYLFKKGLHKKAVRVLTNTIELDLENPELLKVVAKRLMDEKEYTMAIMVYKEIRALRPKEPQSHRDLAIAYVNKKQYQKALDIYTFILSKEWDRFDDIKDTIFNEYNALIAKHRKQLNLKKVKKDYIFSMPLDVRITVSWSSNQNDIDLWVVDPNGEKCYYSHKNTKAGGKISQDFTRGYGPEEYSIKKAPRGLYTVYLHYFSESRQSITGPVTIHATLTTHYGTKQEKSKKIMIQLEKDKDTMQIGILEFR